MAITSMIAGAYTGTYNPNSTGALALNYTRSGYTLGFQQKGERIEETDIYGMSLIEIIYRGAGLTIQTICKVYSTATRQAFWPWNGATGSTFGVVYNAANPIAQQASLINNILVLTVVPNTSAVNNINTFTANVIISQNTQQQIILNSTVREVPLNFDVLLRDTAGTGSLWQSS